MRQQANEKNYLAEAYYLHDMRNVFNVSPWRYQIPQNFMYGGVCHPVDLLRWFLGEVDEVFAYGGRAGLDPHYPANPSDSCATPATMGWK